MLLILLGDTIVENVEQLTVAITPVTGLFPVAVQNSTTTVLITDDDGMYDTTLPLVFSLHCID